MIEVMAAAKANLINLEENGRICHLVVGKKRTNGLPNAHKPTHVSRHHLEDGIELCNRGFPASGCSGDVSGSGDGKEEGEEMGADLLLTRLSTSDNRRKEERNGRFDLRELPAFLLH